MCKRHESALFRGSPPHLHTLFKKSLGAKRRNFFWRKHSPLMKTSVLRPRKVNRRNGVLGPMVGDTKSKFEWVINKRSRCSGAPPSHLHMLFNEGLIAEETLFGASCTSMKTHVCRTRKINIDKGVLGKVLGDTDLSGFLA